MEIKIFKDKKLEINLPTFVDSRALICANSGGGKSYAVRKILEESSNKVMSIVLDVEGEFRTLREKYDFLLIGSEGDVELNIDAAHLLPKKIMELEVSTIIDISDLKRNERIKYIKIFLEALMDLPRAFWKPCFIFLDEAHMLAGQQEKQDSCPAVIDVATRGRKRGYSLVACTQRISKLHKDVVAELNNYMVGRTGLDIDMKRASEILGFTNKQDMLSLRDLEPGEFYVFGTAVSKSVIKAKIGEVKTTHPKVGMDLKKKIIAPTEKIVSILSKLKELPEVAEKEAKNLKDYKTKVLELNREIRILKHSQSKPQIQIDEKSLERARKQGFREAEIEYGKGFKKLQNYHRQTTKKLVDIGKIIGQEIPKFNLNGVQRRPHIQSEPQIKKPVIQVTPIIKQQVTPISDEEMVLGLCEKKLYSLLYQYSERSFSKSQVGVFTGYSHKSGSFSNAVSKLKQLGLIQGSGDNLQILEVKPELIGEFDFSKEEIIHKLGRCEKEIYDVLLQNPEETFGKEELAMNTQTQYSANSGSFSNAISRLNTLGLIHRTEGMIKLNPELLDI